MTTKPKGVMIKTKGVKVMDMQMPKSCSSCFFKFDWGLGYTTYYECLLVKGLEGSVNKRPSWCPLQEVQ